MRHRRERAGGDLKRQQHSIWYVSDQDRATADHLRRRQQLYLWMFTEDLAQRVIPSSLDDSEFGERLLIEPLDHSTEEMLACAFSVSGNSPYRLGYPLSEFTRLLVSELCSYDRVTYEIVYLYGADKATPSGFELMHLNPTQLRRRRGRIVQLVPPDVALERGVSTEVALPEESLVTFRLPRDLRKVIARTVANLDVLSDRQCSSLGLAAMEGKVPYDFATHNRSMMLALAEATRATGWNGRGMLYQHTLSTFWLRREVTFHRFVARVRASILEQINALLQRVGPKLNNRARLSLEGFHTDSALDEVIRIIDTGETPLTEVVNRLSDIRHKEESSVQNESQPPPTPSSSE